MKVEGAHQKTGGRFERDQRKHEKRGDGDTRLDCTPRKGGFSHRSLSVFWNKDYHESGDQGWDRMRDASTDVQGGVWGE